MELYLPFFSIIVPTLNRPEQLQNICLPALAQLDYPRDRYEVIIVDDGSEKSPDGCMEKFLDDLNLIVVKQSHSGPAVARNRGARRARGEILAFTDDDCAPDTEWLKVLSSRFSVTPDCAIGGHTYNALSQNPYSAVSQLLVDCVYDRFNTNPYQMRFFTSNNLAMPAYPFHFIGGFNEIFSLGGEDREFCNRWINCGFGLIYEPLAKVYHFHKMTFRSFLRQHFRYGVGAFRFRRIVAKRKGERMKIENPSFYLNLLRHTCSPAYGGEALFRGILFGCSQAANALGYIWGWLASRARS
ncbi:MAG: glycosyltransferase [Desulfoferrobacter sp.]